MIPKITGSETYTGVKFLFPNDRIGVVGHLDFVEVLLHRLRSVKGYESISLAKENGKITISTSVKPFLENEEYELSLHAEQIIINAGSEAGIAHALTTLYWLIRKNDGWLPEGKIQDAPKLAHRGFLFDPCRHFFDVETAKSLIEQASLRKLNRMHWHLSDDQGYRIESQRFPKLNTVGSTRIEVSGNTTGGYYTFDEIKEVVAFAKVRGMEIIPEIDVPGHVTAMIAAYPTLSCSGEPAVVSNGAGVHARILCAGKDETMSFIKSLLDEVIPLFPYRYFHIGGDEVPKTEWERCPHCQSRIREHNLLGEEALQGWFTLEISRYLESKGKTAICWNDILRAENVKDDIIIQYWDEENVTCPEDSYCSRAFQQNRKCIFSNAPFLYLDYEPSLLPLRKVYGTEPILRTGERIPEKNLLGMECALWSERILDRNRLEQMAFPRLFALAERTWSVCDSYESFKKRCIEEIRHLQEDDVSYFTMEEADICGSAQKQAIISAWKPSVESAKAYGMAGYIPVIRRLISEKLNDQFPPDELQELLRDIFDR